MLTPLRVDKTVEWFNSFIIISKFNGTVYLLLETTRLNQASIKPIYGANTK